MTRQESNVIPRGQFSWSCADKSDRWRHSAFQVISFGSVLLKDGAQWSHREPYVFRFSLQANCFSELVSPVCVCVYYSQLLY